MSNKNEDIDTNYEIDLLLCCARINLNKEIKNKISSLTEKNINWVYLVQKGINHGLTQLLYKNLTLNHEEVPNLILDFLKNKFDLNVKNNLLLYGEMLKVLNLLNSHDIIAIPYKGPALAISAYTNIALREFTDIDIYVDKKDIKKVNNILINNGYKLDLNLDKIKETFFIKHQLEYVFLSKNGCYVNINSRVYGSWFSFSNGINLLLKDTETLNMNNGSILNFTPENLIIILSIHAADYSWTKLKWICDIAELINNHENLNWNQLLNKASELRIKRMILVSLYLAKDLLDLKLPNEILAELNKDRYIKKISYKIKKKIYSKNEQCITLHDESTLKLRMRDNLFNGIKDVIKTFTIPNYAELKNFRFPSFLIPAYYLYKPLNSLRTHNLFNTDKFNIFDPTHNLVAERMLKLANIGSKDVLYDLGCGDGRIVIMAAKEYGTRGVGIDINPELILKSKKNASNEGVENLTDFKKKDALKVDLSDATVLTLFLFPSFLKKLAPKLKKELPSNARIITHNFEIRNWNPVKSEIVTYEDDISSIHLYKIE